MADDLARSFQNIDLGGQDDEAKKAKDLAKKQKRKAAEKEKRKAENGKIIEEKRRRLKEEVKSIVFDRKKPSHPIKQNIWDFKDIIDHIRKQPNPPSSFEEQSPGDFSIIEAAYKSNADILSRITKMLKEFYDTEDYAIKVPSRGKQHQEYDKVHQSIKLKDNYFLRKLTPEPNDMYMVTMCVLLEIFQLCDEEIDANIRDIYYTNTTLYKNEDRINNAIDDICCILHCPRACLRLFATQKGYGYGSMNKSYDYRNLITPNISWLGIKPTDLGTYGIPDNEKCRVPMTTNDRNLCQSLIDAEYLKDNAKWRRELQCMKNIGTKTEIEAFYTFGYKSLANVFIAHKLQQWKL